MLSKWGILSVEMQTAVTSDEKVFRLDENDDLIEETRLSEVEPIETERKEAEKISPDETESKEQTGLFDEKEDSTNKDDDFPF